MRLVAARRAWAGARIAPADSSADLLQLHPARERLLQLRVNRLDASQDASDVCRSRLVEPGRRGFCLQPALLVLERLDTRRQRRMLALFAKGLLSTCALRTRHRALGLGPGTCGLGHWPLLLGHSDFCIGRGTLPLVVLPSPDVLDHAAIPFQGKRAGD